MAGDFTRRSFLETIVMKLPVVGAAAIALGSLGCKPMDPKKAYSVYEFNGKKDEERVKFYSPQDDYKGTLPPEGTLPPFLEITRKDGTRVKYNFRVVWSETPVRTDEAFGLESVGLNLPTIVG